MIKLTENKRFIFYKNDGEIEDTVTQEFHEVDVYRFDYMIVEKMNDLADENKELKAKNEELKSQREDFKRGLAEKDKEIMKLKRENNQMKRVLNG